MKHSFFRKISSVFLREIERIKHDLNIISILLLAPLGYPILMGTIYLNKTESDVPIIVVDEDRSEISRQMIRSLDAHQLTSVIATTGDLNEAMESIYSMQAMGIVWIPQQFSSDIKKHHFTSLKIYINTSRFLISNDINKAVNEVVAATNSGITTDVYRSAGYNSQQAAELSSPIRDDIRQLYNSSNTYGDFFLPGILILILQQTLLIAFSESIAKEREEGTLHALFSAGGNSLASVLAGKTVFYFITSAAYALLYFTLFFTLFKLPLEGNIFILLTLIILLLWSIIMIGFIVSSFFRRKIIALQVIAFTSYPIFLISGYSWPLFAMPVPIRIIAQCIPTTPFYQAFIPLTQYNSSFFDIASPFLHLTILCFLLTGAAIFRLYRLQQYQAHS